MRKKPAQPDFIWEHFEIEQMQVAQMHIHEKKLPPTAEAMEVFWHYLLGELKDKQILCINVVLVLELGFQFKVKTKPQYQLRRFEVFPACLEMADSTDPDYEEKAWTIVRKSLSDSSVLQNNSFNLAADFCVQGFIFDHPKNSPITLYS